MRRAPAPTPPGERLVSQAIEALATSGTSGPSSSGAAVAAVDAAITGGTSHAEFTSAVRAASGGESRVCGHIFKEVSSAGARALPPSFAAICSLEPGAPDRFERQVTAFTHSCGCLRSGASYAQGEMAYFSKTFSADPTCVICSKCWEPALHEGTEWTAYRTGGGMCDVGDAEAIDPVCWPARYRRFVDGSQAAPDPIDALDEGTRERLTVVSKAAVAFVARTMAELRNAHEVEATVARLAAGGTAGGMHPEADAPFHGGADPSEGGVVVSPRPWTTLSLGAREDDEGAAAKRPRQASKPAGPEDQAECSVAVVLHDDDYHTYDDVANALAAAGIAHTMDLTGRVDEEGEAEVAFGSLERGQAAAAGTTSSDGGAAPPAGSPAAAA